MSWTPLALLSALMYTFVNFVDKYVLVREIRDHRCMPIYGGILALVVGALLWVVTGFPTLPMPNLALTLFSGAITVGGAALYFRALSFEETSKIIVLIQMTPLWVLVMSVIFLRDAITPDQLAGFVLVLAAAVGISIQQTGRAFHVSKALWLLLGVTVLWALSFVVVSYVARTNRFEEFVAYESWGLSIGSLGLFIVAPPYRSAFLLSLRTVRKTAIGFILLNELFFVVAKLLGFIAVSLGPAALVSVLGSTQVFFGILLGLLLTTVAPAVYHENIRRQELARKGSFALLVLAGVWLIS